MTKNAKSCESVPKVKKSVPKVEKVYQKLRKCTKSWESVPKVEEVCQKLRKCAKSWRSVPKVKKMYLMLKEYEKAKKNSKNCFYFSHRILEEVGGVKASFMYSIGAVKKSIWKKKFDIFGEIIFDSKLHLNLEEKEASWLTKGM